MADRRRSVASQPPHPEISRYIDPKHGITRDGRLVKIAIDGQLQDMPEDEPLFLLRGRDRLAVETLKNYLASAVKDACTEEHLDGVSDRLTEFVRFAFEHAERMKQPGITRGLL